MAEEDTIRYTIKQLLTPHWLCQLRYSFDTHNVILCFLLYFV